MSLEIERKFIVASNDLRQAAKSPKTLMIWNQRATATRASVATAVEVRPELLAME